MPQDLILGPEAVTTGSQHHARQSALGLPSGKHKRGLVVEERADELIRLEWRQVGDGFAEADQLHRDTEFGFDREHDATLCRTVKFREHHTGDLGGFGELFCLHETVLARRCIDHQ